jgi:hypothetical protein
MRPSIVVYLPHFKEIESGLTATESNSCIEEIHANLLSNMLNRKKAVEYVKARSNGDFIHKSHCSLLLLPLTDKTTSP